MYNVFNTLIIKGIIVSRAIVNSDDMLESPTLNF